MQTATRPAIHPAWCSPTYCDTTTFDARHYGPPVSWRPTECDMDLSLAIMRSEDRHVVTGELISNDWGLELSVADLDGRRLRVQLSDADAEELGRRLGERRAEMGRLRHLEAD